ncbi:hypothetical protein CMQ_220 [Grosmannia clavigera kw1407]|uniref:Uncharacterized protein n=1 Tax=Grosmannia clavigera (strain kw1407 / UAMH 11150) TaxID=655863 RepID=F0XR77_GROCL|nr:uncharacterized protein CMQ_220 [Grosmannia clavigera kw1407]EFW99902.1 hypothetical protein CMQ_220 [Grosmannia clavigera kw1407]
MSTSAALPSGQFITSIGGKRCTAVPRNITSTGSSNGSAATATLSSFSSSSSSSSSLAPSSSSSSKKAAETTTSSIIRSSTTSAAAISKSTQATANGAAIPAPAVIEASTQKSTATDISSSVPAHAPFAAITPVGTVQSSQTDSGVIASPTAASATSVSVIVTSTTPTAEADVGQTSSFPLLSATSSTPQSNPSSNPSSSTAVAAFTTDGGDASSFITSVQLSTTDGASSTTLAVVTTTNSLSNSGASAGSSTLKSTSSKTNSSNTAAVVGGVIGGLALLSLVALLLWLWRRRLRQKRRSTLLTPLSADPAVAAGRGRQRDQAGQVGGVSEKGAYEINRGSIGPTPVATRMKASITYNLQQARSRVEGLLSGGGRTMLPGARGTSPQPSVNMNRGNSQFGNDNMGSRKVGLTPLDRAKDWWSRMANNASIRLRQMRGENGGGMYKTSAGAVSVRGTAPLASGNGSQQQPDFLTLLGMDENELSRAAQNKRTKKRRSNGGSSSSNNFLGPLSVDYSNNPFSDNNVLDGSPAAGQATTASRNPFSDDYAAMPTLQPNTYAAGPRRSRGQAATPLPQPLPPPPPEPASSSREPASRASSSTVATVDTRRNRFRSDPFDLERPERLQVSGVREPMPAAMAATPSTLGTFGGQKLGGQAGVRISGRSRSDSRPASSTYTRTASFTSKYSSGASMYGWNEPGPDVGPVTTQWDDAEAENSGLSNKRKSELQRNHSTGSGTSVGKAL